MAVVLALLLAPLTGRAADSPVAAAKAKIAADYERTIAELIEITEIPAPPFKEAARAARFAKKLRALGLEDVEIDEAGNVMGLRRGTSGADKLLVVSAHLDTVFPEGTSIKVKRDGDRLFAPGIGDDSLGLTALLAWIRALDAGRVETPSDILFVATVGEEGLGDLRGARYLVTKGKYKDRIGGFISVDGSNVDRVTHGAVGSRRYRVEFTGPGGHSYGAFGIVNPMAAMADAVQRLYRIAPPQQPKTTYSASVVRGGSSVNVIPASVTLEVDMRSRDPQALASLEKHLLAIVAEAAEAENLARSTAQGSIEARPVLIGDRPAGETPANDPLVKAVAAAIEANGHEPRLNASSTDSNVAIGLGIPAVTIGTGAGGGRSHTVDEYLNVERDAFVRGLQIGVDVVVAAAGVERST